MLLFAWPQDACDHKAGHKLETDTVQRSEILLYNPEFTNNMRLTEVSKQAIARAVWDIPELKALLPKTWKPHKPTKKKKMRCS